MFVYPFLSAKKNKGQMKYLSFMMGVKNKELFNLAN